jgi:hypothetical protein
VSEDRDLVLPDAFAYRIDQLVEIGDELLDRHGGLGNPAVERFAGAACKVRLPERSFDYVGMVMPFRYVRSTTSRSLAP